MINSENTETSQWAFTLQIINNDRISRHDVCSKPCVYLICVDLYNQLQHGQACEASARTLVENLLITSSTTRNASRSLQWQNTVPSPSVDKLRIGYTTKSPVDRRFHTQTDGRTGCQRSPRNDEKIDELQTATKREEIASYVCAARWLQAV